MECKIEEYQKSKVESVGAPKSIEVSSFDWSNDGEQGKSYTYQMSQERFQRECTKAYHIQFICDGDEYLVTNMTYYDFVDYDISNFISERILEELAGTAKMTVDQLRPIIMEPVLALQTRIRQEFSQTEEAITNQKNQEIIKEHEEKRKKFIMEMGLDGAKYDRCYNVFGELMDGAYLAKLKDMIADREKFSEQSRKKHKQAWRNFAGNNEFLKAKGIFKAEDKATLSKFYKVLAKKYHPDANPGIDTSKEMQLLNEIKKDWGV